MCNHKLIDCVSILHVDNVIQIEGLVCIRQIETTSQAQSEVM